MITARTSKKDMVPPSSEEKPQFSSGATPDASILLAYCLTKWAEQEVLRG